MDTGYKHISYGTGFRIACRAKTWKERSLKEKVLFWKSYGTAIDPVTHEELMRLPHILNHSSKQMGEDLRASFKDVDNE